LATPRATGFASEREEAVSGRLGVALLVHEWMRTRRIGWRLSVGAAIIVLPYLVLGSVIAVMVRDYPLIANNQEAYIGLKEAGLTLRPRVARNAILAAVESAGAQYMVVDAKTAGDRRSALQPLLIPPLTDAFTPGISAPTSRSAAARSIFRRLGNLPAARYTCAVAAGLLVTPPRQTGQRWICRGR
jgi:hypothetical protein